jgi:pimeloyl-ACP methyl ester carboxylesterase
VNVPLYHADLGGLGKPPLLMLHGLLGSSRNWQTVGRDLAGTAGSSPGDGFHVFALDARNHGRSPHDPLMDYEAMVGDVIAWMDARQMPRATIVGHSMGGKTAMRLACRHSDRVARLVVVDIAPKDYFWMAHRGEFAAMNQLALTGLQSRAEAEMRFEAQVPGLGMRKFLSTNLERGEDGRWRWMINLPVLTAVLPVLEKNSLHAADGFDGPVTFIVGGQSEYVKNADHAAIRKHFPLAQIETIADSGHNPHMDARDEFVHLVRGGAVRR